MKLIKLKICHQFTIRKACLLMTNSNISHSKNDLSQSIGRNEMSTFPSWLTSGFYESFLIFRNNHYLKLMHRRVDLREILIFISGDSLCLKIAFSSRPTNEDIVIEIFSSLGQICRWTFDWRSTPETCCSKTLIDFSIFVWSASRST